jgi:hypothetical protein
MSRNGCYTKEIIAHLGSQQDMSMLLKWPCCKDRVATLAGTPGAQADRPIPGTCHSELQRAQTGVSNERSNVFNYKATPAQKVTHGFRPHCTTSYTDLNCATLAVQLYTTTTLLMLMTAVIPGGRSKCSEERGPPSLAFCHSSILSANQPLPQSKHWHNLCNPCWAMPAADTAELAGKW